MTLWKTFIRGPVRPVALWVWNTLQTSFLTRRLWNRTVFCRNRNRQPRWLEIGPGGGRLLGFETLDIVGGRQVDYVADAMLRLPFPDETFDLVYASHILEHIPWYATEQVLREWVRVIRPGGKLEIWVPDAYKVCKVVVDAEAGLVNDIPDDWCPHNTCRSPYLWASGRLFYGANPTYPSWHKAMFTAKGLKRLFEVVELSQISLLGSDDIRGYDHGWINLGMAGTKQ
jgi:SAM-dependent methyltransferase